MKVLLTLNESNFQDKEYMKENFFYAVIADNISDLSNSNLIAYSDKKEFENNKGAICKATNEMKNNWMCYDVHLIK